jgi:hypothetical protein
MPLPPVIFEDDSLIAFDKPSGLLVAPDRWDKKREYLMGLVHAKFGVGVAQRPPARCRHQRPPAVREVQDRARFRQRAVSVEDREEEIPRRGRSLARRAGDEGDCPGA